MNSPQEVFDLFQDSKNIEQAVADKRSESEFLDFKEIMVKEGTADWSQSEKTYNKVAGAFANASGGVIVWGVRSKERGKGKDFDVASEAIPVKGIRAFHRQLNGHSPFNTPSASQLHTIVFTDKDEDTGYVVSLIGRATPLPIMSADRIYYMRSGSNSIPMPDSVVRAMMFSQQRPAFELIKADGMVDHEQHLRRRMGHWYEWKLWVEIVNTGSTRIRDVAMMAHCAQDGVEVQRAPAGTHREMSFVDFGQGKTRLHELTGFVLYPGARERFLRVTGYFEGGERPKFALIKVRVLIGDQAFDEEITITPEDLNRIDD